MTSTTNGGHRLLPDADRKHTKPIPANLLVWLDGFELVVSDQDDSFQVFQTRVTDGQAVLGAAWGHAADDTDVWFAMDWRNPKEAVRVTGARDGALRHILRGHEIRFASAGAQLSSTQAHVVAKHEYDEAIFGGFFCDGACMTPGMREGDDELVEWPCQPLVDAGVTREKAAVFVTQMREAYAAGRWPASAAAREATR